MQTIPPCPAEVCTPARYSSKCTVTTKKQLGPYARNLKQFAFVNIITQSQNMCKFLGCYLGILPLYIGIRIDENISNIYTAAL